MISKKKRQPKLIVALDVDSLYEAQRLVDELYPAVKIFKIGNQLFTHTGPDAVCMVRKKGAAVFLDLKFHDIPNTVASAIQSASQNGVLITNLHASGGSEMMQAAVRARGKAKTPLLLAVTMLTSIDRQEMHVLGIPRTPLAQVRKLAILSKACGMDGVVCSGREIEAVRKACGQDFVILVPGVRLAGSKSQDQKRIITPAVAAAQGADYIVIGRPIIQSSRPLVAAQRIVASFNNDIACLSAGMI